MPLTVTIDDEAHEPGVELYIQGMPLMENGVPYELSKEEETAFVASRMLTVRDAFAGSENVSVSGTASVSDVEKALGVDPTTISSSPSADPTEENKKVAEKLGFPVELINTGGIATDPDVSAPDEESTVDTTLPQQTGVLTPAHDTAADAALGGE